MDTQAILDNRNERVRRWVVDTVSTDLEDRGFAGALTHSTAKIERLTSLRWKVSGGLALFSVCLLFSMDSNIGQDLFAFTLSVSSAAGAIEYADVTPRLISAYREIRTKIRRTVADDPSAKQKMEKKIAFAMEGQRIADERTTRAQRAPIPRSYSIQSSDTLRTCADMAAR